ncbi:MAG TPA: carbohydrate kinase family protein [Bacilli bacterium]|nr:carbohydrate kinase family protein [Bacilli bacterium]HPN61347.1 carbohydrate kinase family protein [Bacilli bacterium]HPX83751.1 carbohydrate kinase family protein [Bacilli bacterium]HQC73946.1 carbohydrate kinase family protein [Bacilli bacterium]
MKERPKILCLGGANIDIKLHLHHMLMLNTSNPVFSTKSWGGVVRNVAENLGRLDCDVSLLSVLGDDELGKELLIAASAFMDVTQVDCLKQKSSGCYYAVCNQQGNMELALADMDIDDFLDKTWVLSKTPLMKHYDMIVADLNIQLDGIIELISWCRSHQQFLVLIGVSGPKMANLPKDLVGIDLIIVNKDETQAYFATSETDLKALALLWKKAGLKRAVITAGGSGLAYFDEHHDVSFLPAKAIENIVDVTGAGDAFSAGVIFGLANHFPFLTALRFGRANASRTIQTETTVRTDLTKTKLLQEEQQDE